MFESTLAFLRMARMNNHNAIPDGDSFGADEDEVIRVRYLPPEPGRVPLIAFEVERSMQHGIQQGVLPRSLSSRMSSILNAVLGKQKLN
jgi:hypothetical protein